MGRVPSSSAERGHRHGKNRTDASQVPLGAASLFTWHSCRETGRAYPTQMLLRCPRRQQDTDTGKAKVQASSGKLCPGTAMHSYRARMAPLTCDTLLCRDLGSSCPRRAVCMRRCLRYLNRPAEQHSSRQCRVGQDRDKKSPLSAPGQSTCRQHREGAALRGWRLRSELLRKDLRVEQCSEQLFGE